jgi:hypothetical protein
MHVVATKSLAVLCSMEITSVYRVLWVSAAMKCDEPDIPEQVVLRNTILESYCSR